MSVPSTLIGLLAMMALARSAFAGDLVVIVHADRDVRLTAAEVAQIYLKQRRFWENGERIVPVNRNSGSAARETFARSVLGGDVRQLVVYWNRQYFRGILPPATLASDEAVRRFVGGEPLSIGYVEASVVDGTVKAVLRIDDQGP